MPRQTRSVHPHPESARILRALERLQGFEQPWTGVVYRTAGLQYATRRAIISGKGPQLFGGRWTPPGQFPAVYASLGPHTALEEALATGSGYGIPLHQRLPLAMVAIDVQVTRSLDLFNSAVRRKLRVSQERLRKEDWRTLQGQGQEAITQTIARLARQIGIQALLVPSSPRRGYQNIVLFPDHLGRGAIRVQKVRQLPNDSST